LCRSCLQTYALHQLTEPFPCVHAPTCTAQWDRDFLDKNVAATFRLHGYKEHRERTLKERERSRLPATQEDAFALKEAKTILETARAERMALQLQLERTQQDIYQRERRIELAKEIIASSGLRRMPDENTLTYGSTTVRPDAKKERAAFIKPCPAPPDRGQPGAPACKGFLSTAWKCGLCETWTCPDCHDWKGESKDTPHTCDAGKVATARFLAREARPCPKCGVSICKIEGCDQMFCTACNTGFGWRTGKIAEGPVHNPHYFEWLRRTGRTEPRVGAAAGATGATGATADPVMLCGVELDRVISRALRPTRRVRDPTYGYTREIPNPVTKDDKYLMEAWRIMNEEADEDRREVSVEEIFRVLRVKYLCDEYNDETWPVALQRAEKNAAVRQAKSDLRAVYVAGARDLIRQVLTPGADKADIRKQVEELVAYCNKCREETAVRFKRVVPPLVIRDNRD
jgi:hypothetical protein